MTKRYLDIWVDEENRILSIWTQPIPCGRPTMIYQSIKVRKDKDEMRHRSKMIHVGKPDKLQ
jgi:hypothetical protein